MKKVLNKIRLFSIRWFLFKPLYKIEKLIDPRVRGELPKYRWLSNLTYQIAKKSID